MMNNSDLISATEDLLEERVPNRPSKERLARIVAGACWAHDSSALNELIWAIERLVLPADADSYTIEEMEAAILEALEKQGE